jgi:uncharacterized membrane protein
VAILSAWDVVAGQSSTAPLTTAIALAAVACAAWQAPWRAWFAGHPDRLNIWLASLVLMALVWSLRAPIVPGASFHFLLVAMLTLMHGWAIALVGLAIVALGAALIHGDPSYWSVFMLCDALVPVAVIHLWQKLVARTLPRNYWVFFFVTGYLGSVLAFAASGLAKASFMLIAQAGSGGHPVGEATLNGFIRAMAIIFHPEWVVSVDADTYAEKSA